MFSKGDWVVWKHDDSNKRYKVACVSPGGLLLTLKGVEGIKKAEWYSHAPKVSVAAVPMSAAL